jgi:hypothetical protein
LTFRWEFHFKDHPGASIKAHKNHMPHRGYCLNVLEGFVCKVLGSTQRISKAVSIGSGQPSLPPSPNCSCNAQSTLPDSEPTVLAIVLVRHQQHCVC